MAISKSLLLKCLGGVAACLGTASLAVVGSESFGSNNVSSESKTELNKLLEKVGLSGCTTENNTSECSISNLKVKYESGSGSGEENKTKQSDSSGTPGKIKVYSDDTYSNKFKFVIEEGDITLTGGTGTSTITKLEQFETYEIKEEDSSNKWFLTRKTKASEGIKTALGLPDTCTLPETTDASSTTPTCTINTTDISKVKFDGVGDGQTVTSSGNIELTITKLSTSEEDFPFDYKFELKATSSDSTTTLTLGNSNTITLKSTEGTEFRIKKSDTGNNITLEEAWTKERLLEKVGLQCDGSSNECTQKSGENINIKFEDNDKLDNKTLGTSNVGKIKLYTGDNATGYNKGFKFIIEEKDISITGESTKKLEQFETYEIKKDETGNKWYLTRKEKAADEIKKALGLPSSDSSCTSPTSESTPTTCSDINGDKLKAINFDGKGNNQPSITNSGTVNLTITKTTETDKYSLGYKFAFDPTEEVTISDTNKIAKSSKTEFKIKVTPSSGTTPVSLSLEKAWTVTTLGAEVGLNCPDPSSGDEKKCSFTENKINVNNGNGDSKIENAKVKDDASGKKMTYEEDQEGYNQGFKFYLEENEDITLTNGSGSDSGSGDKKINKKSGDNGGGDTTYEIKKDESDSKWYLTKKANSGTS